MHGKTALAGAALAAVAAAAPLPQIVTTITQPNNGGLYPVGGFRGFGGNRWGNSYNGYGDWRDSWRHSSWRPRPSYNVPVGYASLGIADSSTTINGGDPFSNFGGYYNNDDDYYKRTGADVAAAAEPAGAASLSIADSTASITKRSEEGLEKRQFGYLSNPAGAWQAWLNYLNGVNNNVIGTSSLGIAGSTFNIDNGYPASAYPVPSYPGADYSGPAYPIAFPYAASSGSSSLTIV